MIQSYQNLLHESDTEMKRGVSGIRENILENEKHDKIRNLAYHETKSHTDTMFAFNIYPCTIPLDFSFVPLHWQDSVELIYIKKGNGQVRVDSESYPVSAGDIVVVLPGHIHGLQAVRKGKMEYENIIFDPDFLSSSPVDVCGQKYLYPLFGGKVEIPVYIGKGKTPQEQAQYGSISACLERVDFLCDGRPWGYELGVKGMMLSFFSGLLSMASETPEKTGDDRNQQKIKNVLLRIEEDYDKRLTIREMAAECGYSESHFMRWFKENTGHRFNDYLIEYRLSRAAKDFRDGHDAVLDIAERNGFENLSNFNRLFKKRFEMTPSQFRKKGEV